MLSVSRDEGLGLGFGPMEEYEVEEGEAFSGQDDHACVDPDIALSYIDEKLQDVLGHFQKDFEGGVSAENLGAKFGGYGSFLPSYQRSPSILTQPKSPPRHANHTILRSPCNSAVESLRQNLPIATNVSISRNDTASMAQVNNSGFVPKMHLNISSRKENFMNFRSPPSDGGGAQQDLSNKTMNISDQKSLKVRLKFGPDNSLTRSNAAIYSGLGLDDCLSSSPENSPDVSGGISPEFRGSAYGSPITILQVMTCFMVPGGRLLSPLQEHLFNFREKESSFRRSTMPHRNILETSIPANSTLPMRELKGYSDKKVKYGEKNGRLMGEEGLHYKSETSKMLESEIDIETLAGKKLLFNALNISISSNLRDSDAKAEKQIVADPIKVTSKVSDVAKDPNKTYINNIVSLSDIPKDDRVASTESLKSIGLGNSENESTHSKGKLNSKLNLFDKALERRPVSNYKDASSDLPRESKSKTLKNDDINSDVCEDEYSHAVHAGPIKKVCSQKTNSQEKDGVKMIQGLDHVHEGKDRQQKGHSLSTAELTKENLKAPSYVVPRAKKKNSPAMGHRSEKKSKILKPRKEMSRSHSREPCGEVVRIANNERVDSRASLLDSSMLMEEAKGRPKLKKDDDAGILKQVANAPIIVPLTGTVPTSDAASTLHAPVLIKENWVACDKCQKWRLLPYGTDPNHLPKKWKCSMQIWLPGLNRCSISEEETQKAFNELYLIPASGTGANLNGHHAAAAGSIASADVLYIDQRHEHNIGTVPIAGKKKYRPMNTSNQPNHVSSKNNLQPSFKNNRASDVNEYHVETNSLRKANVGLSITENQNHRQKEKPKIPAHYSDGGDFMEKNAKHSKSKNKREFDQDGVRLSKKLKEEAAHFLVEDWRSDFDMACKAAPIMNNGLSTTGIGTILPNSSDHSSSKDSTCERKGNLSASIRKSKDSGYVLPNGEFKERSNALVVEKSGALEFAPKKRKLEWQESKGRQDSVISTQLVLDDGVTAKEAFGESDLRKQKKAKVPMYEGRELTISDTDGKMDKMDCSTKILLSGSRECPPDRVDEEERVASGKEQKGHSHENAPSQRALDSTDFFKKYPQLPAAATSSSSMVSGSRKSKANIQEVKGSPVESVSSSPLRIPNTEKVSTKSYSMVKDDVIDVGLPFTGSPKRCSDGEVDGGSDQPGTRRKETGSTGRLRSSEGHRAAESGVLGSLRETCNYKEANHLYGGKATETSYLDSRQIDVSSAEFEETNMVCDHGIDQNNKQHSEGLERDNLHNQDKKHNQKHANGSTQGKSGKNSSLSARERNKSSDADADRIELKVKDSIGSKKDLYSIKGVRNCPSEVELNYDEKSAYQEDTRDRNSNFQEKDDDYLGKKSSSVSRPHANRRGNYSNKETEDNLDARNKDFISKATLAGSSCKSSFQENLQLAPSYPIEEPSDIPDRIDQLEITSMRGKSVQPSTDKQEAQSWPPKKVSTPTKGNRTELYPIDAVNKSRKSDNQNGKNAHSLRQATPNGHRSASPMRKDGPAAAQVLKEARDLKHTANNLKKEGLDHESIGIYFESALKFLHYASLLEPSNADNARQGDLKHMMHMYSETAKLFMYCAHEYDRCKEMAYLALAYKCVEVAYMKAAYYKHPGASKDRHELQTALQTALPGESPSSSASDVDNLNNHGASLDKAISTKPVGSPQNSGNYIIAARNRPHFMGLLSYTNDIICAFEATKKSQSAMTVASANLDKVRDDGLSKVREVLDFNYHNVEELLRLVRLSMVLISR